MSDPATRAAEEWWRHCEKHWKNDDKFTEDCSDLAAIIRRETKCDEMRNLLKDIYDNPGDEAGYWAIELQRLLKDTQ